MLKNSKSAEKSVLRGAKEVVAVEQYWHKAERPKVTETSEELQIHRRAGPSTV